MIHAWDHFDYTNDVAWWKDQGWPLVKVPSRPAHIRGYLQVFQGIAQFHLQKLIPDEYFNDSSLVVAPCNSPEQPPVTFGCSHSQQIIWQVFNAIEKGASAGGETDNDFLTRECLQSGGCGTDV